MQQTFDVCFLMSIFREVSQIACLRKVTLPSKEDQRYVIWISFGIHVHDLRFKKRGVYNPNWLVQALVGEQHAKTELPRKTASEKKNWRGLVRGNIFSPTLRTVLHPAERLEQARLKFSTDPRSALFSKSTVPLNLSQNSAVRALRSNPSFSSIREPIQPSITAVHYIHAKLVDESS